MLACFDAFAAEREAFGIDETVWSRCIDKLAACGAGERDEHMTAILCKHFLVSGTKVIITGLQARPELNGRVATIIGEIQDGRIPAEVHDGEKPSNVRTGARLRLPNMRPTGSGQQRPPAHTVRIELDGDMNYVHTTGVCALGAGRELFVRDVPCSKAQAVAELLNFLVSRMEEGHPVSEPQICQRSGLQMEVAIHPPHNARDLSDAYFLQLPRGNELVELIPGMPVQPSDTDTMWSRVPTVADQAKMPGISPQQIGMPQSLAHQGDILPWSVSRAAEAGDEATVSAYLQGGVLVNTRTTAESAGITLLMLAAREGQTRMVVLLLARGAEPNLRHAVGGTALMSAAERGHEAVIQQLLRATADPTLVDADGCTALDYAEEGKHPAAAAALRNALRTG